VNDAAYEYYTTKPQALLFVELRTPYFNIYDYFHRPWNFRNKSAATPDVHVPAFPLRQQTHHVNDILSHGLVTLKAPITLFQMPFKWGVLS